MIFVGITKPFFPCNFRPPTFKKIFFHSRPYYMKRERKKYCYLSSNELISPTVKHHLHTIAYLTGLKLEFSSHKV